MGTFDPNTFLSQEVKGANETKYTPIPKGEYHGCYIDEISMAEYDNKPILVVTTAIPDENLKKTLGMEKPIISDRIFLDYENGALLFGQNKNIKLGRLREAIGQNKPNVKWSFNLLRGAGPFSIMVDHQPGKGDNDGEVFARVTRYAKAA
jgi:hypothetical protein